MKFIPEDFMPNDSVAIFPETAAAIANAKLQEWLSKAPLVAGTIPDNPRWLYELKMHGCVPEVGDTHVGKLVCIKEIENE